MRLALFISAILLFTPPAGAAAAVSPWYVIASGGMNSGWSMQSFKKEILEPPGSVHTANVSYPVLEKVATHAQPVGSLTLGYGREGAGTDHWIAEIQMVHAPQRFVGYGTPEFSLNGVPPVAVGSGSPPSTLPPRSTLFDVKRSDCLYLANLGWSTSRFGPVRPAVLAGIGVNDATGVRSSAVWQLIARVGWALGRNWSLEVATTYQQMSHFVINGNTFAAFAGNEFGYPVRYDFGTVHSIAGLCGLAFRF